MSEIDTRDFPVGAYFYPQTMHCPVRAERAAHIGRQVLDETLLVQEAQPLFPGHMQPQAYCLGDPEWTRWDDTDDAAMRRQVELMQEGGLDFVVFDTYGGSRQGGAPQRELEEPTSTFLRIPPADRPQLAIMWCLSSSRVDLPASTKRDNRTEAVRNFDQSPLTARFIVDECVEKYWDDPNYLHMRGRPYLSVYNIYSGLDNADYKKLEEFTGTIREYAIKQYRLDPYIVAVDRRPWWSFSANKAGLDAVTGYALLPDFSLTHEPLQKYADRVEKVSALWEGMVQSIGLPFVPPAVVGWDASPRGEQGSTLVEVAGKHPFTPILTEGTAEQFGEMLTKSMQWTQVNVPPEDQYGLVCSMNEIAEGHALLPKVIDGQADMSYLRQSAASINSFRKQA